MQKQKQTKDDRANDRKKEERDDPVYYDKICIYGKTSGIQWIEKFLLWNSLYAISRI